MRWAYHAGERFGGVLEYRPERLHRSWGNVERVLLNNNKRFVRLWRLFMLAPYMMGLSSVARLLYEIARSLYNASCSLALPTLRLRVCDLPQTSIR